MTHGTYDIFLFHLSLPFELKLCAGWESGSPNNEQDQREPGALHRAYDDVTIFAVLDSLVAIFEVVVIEHVGRKRKIDSPFA